MSLCSHMRHLSRKGKMRWHASIADYIEAVIRRISRRRVVWCDEMWRIASDLSDRYSGAPSNTLHAVMRGGPVCVVNGYFSYPPEQYDMEPRRAWEEGRQCIPLDRDRCECGRAVIYRFESYLTLCPPCRRLWRAQVRLEQDFKDIRRLTNKLVYAMREAKRAQEHRRAA